MHRGRLFEQLRDRWASPDFLTSAFAPKIVVSRPFLEDLSHIIWSPTYTTHEGVVDGSTGVITWTADPQTIGPWGDWDLEVTQDACRRPGLRRWGFRMQHLSEFAWSSSPISASGEEAWFPDYAPSEFTPTIDLLVGPFQAWPLLQLSGKAYH
jgi:hypothetical protein